MDRHPVGVTGASRSRLTVRVCDLVDDDPAVVTAALARQGVPVGSRDTPAGPEVRAQLAGTLAGTVVVLEQRAGRFTGRGRGLRELRGRVDRLRRDLVDPGAGTTGG